VTQIAQVAKSLLPLIHTLQGHPASSSTTTVALDDCVNSFGVAMEFLRILRPKFDVVIRHLDPLESYAQRLGVPLPYISQIDDQKSTGTSGTSTGVAGGNLFPDAPALPRDGQEVQQPGQTSGQGAIQALLSLSGRTGDSDGDAGLEGADAWWSSILHGALEGCEQHHS
jgi:hypothetical protein